MLVEIRSVCEGLPAFWTDIGLLSCVNPLMDLEVWLLGEGFLTVRTLVRFLCSVHSLVRD